MVVDLIALVIGESVAARVVSLPSWYRFELQTQEYRDRVLPPSITARIAIEAGVTSGWQKWVGAQGVIMGIDRFGASAPYQQIYQHLGLTPDHITAQALALLGRA